MHQDVVHNFESERVTSVRTLVFTYTYACKKKMLVKHHPAIIYVDAWVKKNAAGECFKESLTSFRQIATTFPFIKSNSIIMISTKESRIHPKCNWICSINYYTSAAHSIILGFFITANFDIKVMYSVH